MSWLVDILRFLVDLIGFENLQVFGRLALSLVLGGVVGIEREKKHQPAGFRTHVVLCVGATLIMLTSLHVAEVSNTGPVKVADPGRIAAQVVSGVGFLGGGAILRMGATIRGLTTAASLWTTTAIGLAIGCGYYFGAIAATLLMYATLHQLSQIEKSLIRSKTMRNLLLTTRDVPGILGAVERILLREGGKILSFRASKTGPEGRLDVVATVEFPPDSNTNKTVKELLTIREVLEVDLT